MISPGLAQSFFFWGMILAGGPSDRNILSPPAVDPAWEKLISARLVFEMSLCSIIMEKFPEYKDCIALQCGLREAGMKLKSMQFYFILDRHPERIRRDQGPRMLRALSWSGEDQAASLEFNEHYRKMVEFVARLKEQRDAHPDWNHVKTLADKGRADPRFLEIRERYEMSEAQVGRILAESIEQTDKPPSASKRNGG